MLDWPDAAKQGALYAAAINVVLLGLLFLTRRWWSLQGDGPRASASSAGTPTCEPSAAVPAGGNGRAARLFWLGLAGIVVLAGVLRVPLARSSLWWDEVWQARNASVGEWRPDRKNPGQLKFRETTYAQALWNYRKPANHPPMAAASKVGHDVWRKLTGAEPGAFDEFVLRLPGFLASLAGIALVALLLRAWGLAGAGLVAALFLALHPWHIRYGIDNRGYTFLVPLTLIGLWSLWRACGPGARVDGRPRNSAAAWWVFGLSQALILWSHLLSVWVCLALSLTGGWWIWKQHAEADRWRRMARLGAVQVAGAMVFFQLFLPNLLQAIRWGEKNQDGRLLDGTVLMGTLQEVATGTPLPWGPMVVLAMATIGVVHASRKRIAGAAGIVVLLASAAAFLAAVWAIDFYFYPRFLFAVMAPLAIAVGLGVWALGERAWGGRHGLRFLGAAAVGAMLVPGLAPREEDLRAGFSPLREAAAVLREAEAQGAQIFGYGFGAEALQYYLPTLKYARESDAPQALAAAVDEARTAGRPLLVVTGYEELNRLALPEGFMLLDDRSRFSEMWRMGGIEPQFAYRIRSTVTPHSGIKESKF